MKRLCILHPATFKLDGGAMFGIIPKPLWQKKIAADELNRIAMSLRIVLVQNNNRNILIDTGIGHYHDSKFTQQFDIRSASEDMESFLRRNFNLGCQDITDVIATHLHFDHIGGLGKDTPVYPNATLHVHGKHLEYSQHPTLRDAGSFHSHIYMPLINWYQHRGKLNLLDGDEGEIADTGVRFLTSFGHTPYMIHPIFGGHIYMADLVPMSHHVNIPWVMGYDIEPGTSTVYKQKFYQTIMEQDLTMIFEHDIDVWGGKLAVDEHGKYQLKEPLKTHGQETICLELL